MNSRQRFLASMCGGQPDHPPLFPEGIREEVLQAWRSQGLPAHTCLEDIFYYDQFEELLPEIYPLPEIRDWSNKTAALHQLQARLDPDDPSRLPQDWSSQVSHWQARQFPLFLRIHQGLFLSLGIEGWSSFSDMLLLLVDDPQFVHAVLAIQADFAARLARKILSQVQVDAVIFSEPIAGPSGSLISPQMYRHFALASYTPVFEVLDQFQVPVVIWRSYASPDALIPEVARSRFTTIWVCETDPKQVDYARLRARLGPQLGLIGGIDTDVLRRGRRAIHQAVTAVLPLVEQGGFIPLADGRVREEVPYANYVYYRRLLERLIAGS